MMSKTKQAIGFPLYEELFEFISLEMPELKTLSREEFIFKKYDVERIGKVLRYILTTLGLKDEGYNLKTFRKTFASKFAEKGIGLSALADLLGHTSTNTTRQFYKKKNVVAIGKRIDSIGGLKIC